MGIITDKQMARKAGKRDLWLTEDAPRGAGRFVARITPAGERLFYFRYTAPGGRREWLSIGPYHQAGKSGFTVADARRKAAEYSTIYQGGDKDLKGRLERLSVEAAYEESQILAEVEKEASRLTVTELFERWERRGLCGRKDRGAEVRRSFEKDILPVMGAVFADEVKRGMIADCLDSVVERGAPIIARNLLGDLRQMFGFAIKRNYVENDPTSHLKRDDFGRKVERDRVLDDNEVRLLFTLLQEAELQEASIAAIWIMLSTCCRVGEISQARWEQIDFEAGTWWLPPANTKNAKEHTVVLSDFAKRHFQTLRRLVEESASKEEREVSPWVLPASRQGTGHVCLKSLAKQVGDRQRGDSEPMSKRSKLTRSLQLPKGKWTPHDLRRTGATLMGKLGVRPDVIEKCLNHIEQNRLVRIYQRQTLREEQREAWRLLGERLELLTSNTENVVLIDDGRILGQGAK